MQKPLVATVLLTLQALCAQAGEAGAVRLAVVDPLTPVGGAKGDPIPDGPLQTLRLVGPRNGTASAQVVVTQGAAPTATIGALTSKEGATLPAGALAIRYAVLAKPAPKSKDLAPYCDVLLDAPAGDADVQPIWLTASIPADAAAGVYTGTLTVTSGGKATPVPVELTVSAWKAPSPKEGRSIVGLFPSFEATAKRYNVALWSEEHWKLLEQSLRLLGRTGNDIIHIPLVAGTFVSQNQSILTFTRKGADLVPDFTIFDRYLALYHQQVGAPKILVLDVWDPTFEDSKTGKFAPTYIVGNGSAYEPVKGPNYGEPGSETTWKAVMDGIKASLKKVGWDKSIVILGEAADARPSAEIGAFFDRLSPGICWDIFTHGRGDPKLKDDEIQVMDGIRYLLNENPWGKAGHNPKPEAIQGHLEISDKETMKVSSTRHNWVQNDARPSMYRALPDVAVTKTTLCLTRYGLDYWDGVKYGGWFNLWRNNATAVIAAGPNGPVSTVRFEMLVEGIQELEARLVIEDALTAKSIPEALAKQASDLLIERRTIRFAGKPSWPAGPNWQELTRRLYDVAGEIAKTAPAKP